MPQKGNTPQPVSQQGILPQQAPQQMPQQGIMPQPGIVPEQVPQRGQHMGHSESAPALPAIPDASQYSGTSKQQAPTKQGQDSALPGLPKVAWSSKGFNN